jgi:glucokinase
MGALPGRLTTRRFVVVSGLPGSGKTTVARALAPLLELPVIDKDEILERLFDSRGVGDGAWRRRLSRESDDILQATACASDGAIVASFWRVRGMPEDSGTPTAWLDGLSQAIVNVHCACPPDVAADRFLRRVRHAGHLDAARTAADVRTSIHALPCGPLSIGEPLVVDTTAPVAAHALSRSVALALDRRADRRRTGG